MRKAKRILSLALTAAMLLGMLIIPTGAASTFKDSAEIVNTEAVEITAGLGLFAGSGGYFMPKGTVTRAQMATIIVKMIHGADADANAFKNMDEDGSFTDIVEFEGGWAEGYINWCSSMGVVAGYGDGTFKPGKSVTTAEALTMIINALGIDAGPGEWPTTILAKADELKLYGDLEAKPGTHDPLTRDELAVIALAGLEYSPEGETGWRAPTSDIVFEKYTDAIKANGGSTSGITEVVGEDSLASKVYKMSKTSGFLTENQATGAEQTWIDGVAYNAETGLDMLGHYVTVYFDHAYKSQGDPGNVFAIIDDSEAVTVDEDIVSSSRDYKAAFGKGYDLAKKVSSDNVLLFDATYDCDANDDGNLDFGTVSGYTKGSDALAGTYVIYENAIVAYLPALAWQVSKVTYIDDATDNESITLSGNINNYEPIPNSEHEDKVVEYQGIAVGDYVLVAQTGDIYSLSPITTVTGTITRSYTDDSVPYVTLNGVDYPKFMGTDLVQDLNTNAGQITYNSSYTLYLTADGEFIGWEKGDASTGGSTADLTNVRYMVGAYIKKVKNQYGEETKYVYAQGSNFEGKEVSELIGVLKTDGTFVGDYTDADAAKAAVTEGFYTVEELEGLSGTDKKLGVLKLTKVGTIADYDEKDSPFFVGTNMYANLGSTFTQGAYGYYTFHYCDDTCNFNLDAGASPWGHGTGTSERASTRMMNFITIGGEVEEELEIANLGSSYTYTVKSTSEAKKHPVLFTKNSSNFICALYMVFREDPADMETGGDAIYFSDTQLAQPFATVPDGNVYQCYEAASGKLLELTFADDYVMPTQAGFYEYSLNEGYAEVGTRFSGDGAGEVEGTKDQVINESLLTGVHNKQVMAEKSADDGSSMDYIACVSALVIDTRTEDEIETSGVAEITSMEQLENVLVNGGCEIKACGFKRNQYNMAAIYVTSVTKPTKLGIPYFLPATSVAGDNVVYTLDGEPATLYLNQTGADVGFVTQKSINGAISAVPAAGSFVEEQVVTSCTLSGGTYTIKTEDGGTYTFESTNTTVNLDPDIAVNMNLLVGRKISAALDGNAFKALFVHGREQWQKERDEMLEELEAARPTAPVCGGHTTGWTKLTKTTGTLAAGKYYLDGDVTLTGELKVSSGEVTLCLNGHTMTGKTKAVMLNISGGTVNICDCSAGETGKLLHVASGQRIVKMTGGATLNLFSGTLTSNGATLTVLGTGVYIDGGSKFNMLGGAVTNIVCSAQYGGGGVYVNNGTFNMYGGEISYNKATDADWGRGGGVVVNNGHTFNLIDGFIKNNSAQTTNSGRGGGGVSANDKGHFNMFGGTITGNTAPNGQGGGLWSGGLTGVKNLYGGTITGNTAASGSDVFGPVNNYGVTVGE